MCSKYFLSTEGKSEPVTRLLLPCSNVVTGLWKTISTWDFIGLGARRTTIRDLHTNSVKSEILILSSWSVGAPINLVEGSEPLILGQTPYWMQVSPERFSNYKLWNQEYLHRPLLGQFTFSFKKNQKTKNNCDSLLGYMRNPWCDTTWFKVWLN